MKKQKKKFNFKLLFVCLGVILISALLCILNAFFINTKQINIREETIYSQKVNDKYSNLTIAFFSDLHFGNYIDSDFVTKMVTKIQNYQPDIIIFGGDLVDHISTLGLSDENCELLIGNLSLLDAKLGKFAVLGNHDLDSEESKYAITKILEESGFKIITNTNQRIYIDTNNHLNLVGLDSMSLGEPDPITAFENVDSSFTMVITHCPDLVDSIPTSMCDYILCGHSHGGQVYIPIVSLFSRPYGCTKYFKGKNKVNGVTLDISNGVGRTKKNVRFLADAEVVIYKLKAA